MHSLGEAYMYEEIAHWRPNFFKLPLGKAGISFTAELACIYNAFTTNFGMEWVALKAAVVLSILGLQKPSRKSKNKGLVACLEKRLPLWLDGNFSELITEGRTIQCHRPKPVSRSKRKDHTPCSRLNRNIRNVIYCGG